MADGISEAEEKLKGHIGFEKEKKTFLNHIQVICYVGAPGMGKTTFVQTLAGAMKRPCAVVSLSGFQESAEYSILGEEDKPKLTVKDKINVNELPDFTREEKKKILRAKANDIQEKHQELVIPDQIIEAILNHIREVGVRQAERALYKLEEEYIYTKNKGEKFTTMENPRE
ncbi:16724_t:CDS:2 [Entrophospora sp. SA101]|nr:16724_t:CDS:2 [Entrophospora sp. SA101]